MMSSLALRLNTVRERIARATTAAGRAEGTVRLLAVSKTVPCARLLAGYRLGLRDFGESYLQEALPKLTTLAHCDISWHFIGPIQSNKTRPIAAHFHWVHSVDRIRIAERLNEQRPMELPPLNICVQVNISGETTKAGVALEELPYLIEAVASLARLRLRGLMAVPAPGLSFDVQRQTFRRLREALLALHKPDMDTLSMGMSDDFDAAIMEGATMVRLGSAIFGARPDKPDSEVSSSPRRA